MFFKNLLFFTFKKQKKYFLFLFVLFWELHYFEELMPSYDGSIPGN